MTAKEIIERDIEIIKTMHTKKSKCALCMLHALSSKVSMAIQLGALTYEDLCYYTDLMFKWYEDLEP